MRRLAQVERALADAEKCRWPTHNQTPGAPFVHGLIAHGWVKDA